MKTIYLETADDIEIINIEQIVSVFWDKKEECLTLHLSSDGSRVYYDMKTITYILKELRNWGIGNARTLQGRI